MASIKIIILWGTIFSSLRMLIGSFSAIYLLNRGLTLLDIGMLKTFQASIILLSDIPLAYTADRYSRKWSIVTSTLLGGMWLILTGIGGLNGSTFWQSFLMQFHYHY